MLSPLLSKILLASTLLLGASTALQTYRLKNLRLDHIALQRDAKDLAARYVGTSDALERCRKSVQNMVAAAEQQKQAGEQAAARLAKLAASLAQSQARIRAAEDADRALPACETLLRTDLAAVCPGRALGVRQRALRGPRYGSFDSGTGAG